jgi:hypothetical protein
VSALWSIVIIPKDNPKYLDFLCSFNPVERCYSITLVFHLEKLDPVTSFKFLVANECKPALCENWLWVSFLASRALKGPDEATLIYFWKISDMATFKRCMGEAWKTYYALRVSCEYPSWLPTLRTSPFLLFCLLCCIMC